MKEIWKPIDECSLYEVSNLSRVRSYKSNSGSKRSYPVILTPKLNNQGYYHIGVIINGIKTTRRRGRLVAQAFVENPDNKKFVNHIDGDKTNDLPNNLEWVTASENMTHAYRNGLNNNKGMNAPYRKLFKNQVIAIRNGYESGKFSQQKLSRMYNVDASTINKIVNSKTWVSI